MPAWSFIQDTPLGAQKREDLRCTRKRGDADSPLLAVNNWLDAFPPPPRANAEAGGDFLRERLARCERLRRMYPNLVPVDFYDSTDVVAIADERNEQAIRDAERIGEETGAVAEIEEAEPEEEEDGSTTGETRTDRGLGRDVRRD
jgi:hypothetical protein